MCGLRDEESHPRDKCRPPSRAQYRGEREREASAIGDRDASRKFYEVHLKEVPIEIEIRDTGAGPTALTTKGTKVHEGKTSSVGLNVQKSRPHILVRHRTRIEPPKHPVTVLRHQVVAPVPKPSRQPSQHRGPGPPDPADFSHHKQNRVRPRQQRLVSAAINDDVHGIEIRRIQLMPCECTLRELALQRRKTKTALGIVSENKLYASIAEATDTIIKKNRFAHSLTLASR
jgi:hypothetical protein